jgi:DNA transposition AAA+ family ATPase
MEKLQELFQQSGLTITELATQLGMSRPAISAALKGKYQGRKDLGCDIEKFLTQYIAKNGKAGQQPSTTFMTSSQKMVLAVLHYTMDDHEFSIITGPSGVGKTHICQAFADTQPGVLYIKMVDGMSYGDIVDEMLEEFHVSFHGDVHRRFKRLIECLNENETRMLIVDEVDLFTKGSAASFLKKVSIFREIYEKGFPVVLVGLPALAKRLRESEERYIYSRIGYFRSIKAVDPGELMAFWQHLGGGTEPEVPDVIRQAGQKAYLRTIGKVFARSQLIGIRPAMGLIFE